MALIIADAPAAGLHSVRDALARSASLPEPMAEALGRAGDVSLSVSVPHPVYGVELRDVADGRPVAGAAQLHGWRYLLFGGDQAVGAAEVSVEDAGDEVRFGHLNHGPFVDATVDGLEAAEALPEVERGAFEVRLLRIVGLNLVALWLHGADELFLPLPPAPPGLVPMRAYRDAELVEAVRETAARRLRFDDQLQAAPPR